VSDFLEDLQMQSPPIQRVNAGRLIAHIDHSWDHRRSLCTRIGRLLPALQHRALENNRLAVELLQNRAHCTQAVRVET
jgi:hypothetical protein